MLHRNPNSHCHFSCQSSVASLPLLSLYWQISSDNSKHLFSAFHRLSHRTSVWRGFTLGTHLLQRWWKLATIQTFGSLKVNCGCCCAHYMFSFQSFNTQTFLVCDAACSFSFSMLTRLLFSLHIAGTPFCLSFTSKTACFLTLTHDIAHFNHILVQKLSFSKCCDVVISSTTVNLAFTAALLWDFVCLLWHQTFFFFCLFLTLLPSGVSALFFF